MNSDDKTGKPPLALKSIRFCVFLFLPGMVLRAIYLINAVPNKRDKECIWRQLS